MTQASVDRQQDSGPHVDDPNTSRRHWRRLLRRFEGPLLQVGFILALLGIWQALTSFNMVSLLIVSSPPDVARALVDYFTTGTGWSDLSVSLYEFVVGFAISVCIGVPLGIAIGWYRRLGKMTAPVFIVLLASPRVAFIPIFLVWLGIGPSSKIAIVVFSAIVPIALTTKSGVTQTDRDLVRVCKAYGGTNWSTFRTIVLPSSVPSIAAGVRLGTGFGVLAVIIGEYLASSAGIGYQLQVAASNFRTDLVFALVIIAATMGVVLSGIASLAERVSGRWRPQTH